MHRRISHTLNTLRQGLAAKLGGDFIDHACRLADHSWCDSCLLTPAAIIHWFLVQILHGNTSLTHVSLLAGRAFTGRAFCLARARLPLAVFQTVLRELVRRYPPTAQHTIITHTSRNPDQRNECVTDQTNMTRASFPQEHSPPRRG